MAVCCLVVFALWLEGNQSEPLSAEFWWSYYSVVFFYGLASIVFRMGWIVPCMILGVLVAPVSFVTHCRCGPLEVFEQFVTQFMLRVTIEPSLGLIFGLALDGE